MIVGAAILGLGYLGLAVQKQLSVLAEATENKPKTPWDIFFEGIEGEDGLDNFLTLFHDLREMGMLYPSLGYGGALLYQDGYENDLDYEEHFDKLSFYWSYWTGKPRQLLQHPSYYHESAEYTNFMKQIEDVYNSEATIRDRVMAFEAIVCGIQSSENYNSLSKEHHDGSNDSELSVLYSYLNYYNANYGLEGLK
jgi:hypothetical protein